MISYAKKLYHTIFRMKHKLLTQHMFKNKNKYSVLMTIDVYIKNKAIQFT